MPQLADRGVRRVAANLALLLLAHLVGCGAAAAQSVGAGYADRWSVGARYGVAVTDQSFDNDGDVWQATIGRTFGPKYAFELELTGDEYDFGIDYGLKHRAIGVNHMTINREPLWDPYFLLGVGWIEYDAPDTVEQRRGNNFMFNVGIGGQWELVLPERVFLRADLRLRYDLNDTRQPGQNGAGDGLFTVGLVVPLGR